VTVTHLVGSTLAATTATATATADAMAGHPQLAIFGWGQSQSRTRTCVTLLHEMGAENHGKPILWISNGSVG